MPKSRRRVKARSGRKLGRNKRRAVGAEYVIIPVPSSDEASADGALGLRQLGHEYGGKYAQALQELGRRILEVDPLSLLSNLAFYGLPTRGLKDPELTQPKPILQHHVELLQALTLQHPRSAFSVNQLPPQDYMTFRDLLHDVTNGFRFRGYAGIDPSLPGEEQRRRMFLEEVKRHTQSVRNWGYPQQVTRIVADLFEPLDNAIEKKFGVRIGNLVEMCGRIKTSAESRSKAHHTAMHEVVKAKKVGDAVRMFQVSFPNLVDSTDEWSALAQGSKASLPEVRQLLISLSESRLPAVFSFTTSDFISAYPSAVEQDNLRRVLTAWSISFGELAGADTEHFFLNNPIWSRPLVTLGPDQFFVPVVGTFTSFLLRMMERVIEGDAHLRGKYEKRRADFLEDDAARLFREAFPTASIFRGSLWHDPEAGKNYENDLLVQVDTHFVVVEAKSGKVSESAWRGSVERLKKAVQGLVVEPSEQAARFATHLKANAGVNRFKTKSGNVNEIDTSNVSGVIRLNVTLELLSIISAYHPTLREAGLLAPDIEVAPTMSLAELESAFELLGHPSEKLHYLARRAELEANSSYFGDELDLLAFYLDRGFCIGETEFDRTKLMMLYGDSKTLDPYFMRQWHKQPVPKPKRPLTKWWESMLERIETSRTQGWSELGQILLGAAYDEQMEFERGSRRIKRSVRLSGQGWRRECLVTMLVGVRHHDAIIGVAFKDLSREGRREFFNQVIDNTLQQESVQRVMVIGWDIDEPDQLYNVVFAVRRRAKSHGGYSDVAERQPGQV
jgi:hypothetical protein